VSYATTLTNLKYFTGIDYLERFAIFEEQAALGVEPGGNSSNGALSRLGLNVFAKEGVGVLPVI
jgi:hypothetical protein